MKFIFTVILFTAFQAQANGLIILSKFENGDTVIKTDMKTTEVVADTTLTKQRFLGISHAGNGQYIIAGEHKEIYQYDFLKNTILPIFFHNDLSSITGIAANNENDIFLVKAKRSILRVKDSSLMPNTSYPYINERLGDCILTGTVSVAVDKNILLAISPYVNNKILVYDVSTPTAVCLENYHFNFNGYLNFSKLLRHKSGNYFVGDSTGKVFRFSIVNNKVTDTKFIHQSETPMPVNALADSPSGNLLVSFGRGAVVEMDLEGKVIHPSYLKSIFTDNVIDMISY